MNLIHSVRRIFVFLDDAPEFRQRDVLTFRSDDDRLDEELVAALGSGGRVFLHRLQQDLDFDRLSRFDPARVGTDAVLFRRGRLDFVSDRLRVVVRDGEGTFDQGRERTLEPQLGRRTELDRHRRG